MPQILNPLFDIPFKYCGAHCHASYGAPDNGARTDSLVNLKLSKDTDNAGTVSGRGHCTTQNIYLQIWLDFKTLSLELKKDIANLRA